MIFNRSAKRTMIARIIMNPMRVYIPPFLVRAIAVMMTTAWNARRHWIKGSLQVIAALKACICSMGVCGPT